MSSPNLLLLIGLMLTNVAAAVILHVSACFPRDSILIFCCKEMAVYPEYMVAPIRQDLTEAGFEQLMTPEAVDSALAATEGTVLVAVNSVCGCAAGKARPALKLALASSDKKPGKLVTVFAGMETDAVNQMRQHMLPYPPSSPCIGLFKDGELVHMIERYHIEGSDLMRIVNNLQGAFEEYC